MLTQSQIQAIKAHVALDERTQELIRLATRDLYNGPGHVNDEDYPGFSAAVHLISDAFEATDLYLDNEIDEVIGDTEPHWHGECGCTEESEIVGYYPEHVIHLDARDVVRYVVGKELARYV